MQYYRADEQPRMPSSARRYVDTRRSAPRQESRIPLRATREHPAVEQEEGYYDNSYEEQQYVQYPSRHTPPPQQIVRMRQQQAPQKQTSVYREEGYEKKPIQPRMTRRRLCAFVGIGLALIALGINDYVTNVKLNSDTAKYGNNLPPTFYTTAVVGHNGDSEAKPSHFTVQNQNGHVLIFELPAGDPGKTIVYSGMVLFGSEAEKAQTPVSLKFADTNGDGKLDMQVVVAQRTMTYINDGTKFVAPQNPNLNVNA